MKALAGACVAALVVGLAGEASAQRSLFDQPTAETGTPAGTPSATPGGTPTPARPRPKPRKPRGPTPARVLSINNASPMTLVGLEVSGDGKTAKLTKPLPSKRKTTLKLPAFTACTVSISASFEGQAQPEASELDICKEKQIRFTE